MLKLTSNARHHLFGGRGVGRNGCCWVFPLTTAVAQMHACIELLIKYQIMHSPINQSLIGEVNQS